MSFIGISTNIWKDTSGAGGGGASWVLAPNGDVASLDIDFVNSRAWNNGLSSINTLLTCSRAAPLTDASYTTVGGTILYFAANTLRNGDNGLLVEEGSENVFQGSQNFQAGSAGWGNNRCNVVANVATAPDGTFTANIATVTIGVAPLLQRILPGTATYAVSLYTKFITTPYVGFFFNINSIENSIAWNIQTASAAISTTTSFVSSGLDVLANGWFRIWVVLNSENVNSQGLNIGFGDNPLFGDPTTVGQQTYVWGSMVERNSFPTSYLPNLNTAAVSVTRSADVVLFTTSMLSVFTPASGTFVTRSLASGGGWLLSDDSTDTFAFSNNGGTAITIQQNVSTNVISQTDTVETPNIIAAAYSDTTYFVTINGDVVASASATSSVIQYSDLWIGSNSGVGSFYNSYIQRITFWNSKLANATMTTLTSA